MAGTIALIGGGELTSVCDEVEQSLLAQSGGSQVVVIPTAQAYEHPDRLIGAATSRLVSLGATAVPARVLSRRDANEPEVAAIVANARFVYLLGNNPMHQRSALKDTAVWSALATVLENDGVVAAAGGAASGLCDPMVDPRGGGLGLGLGLVKNTALIIGAESVPQDHLARTLGLAEQRLTVLAVSTGSAALSRDGEWSAIGTVTAYQDGQSRRL